jgi:hypothetical protein
MAAEFLLAPPLPALIALAIALGVGGLANRFRNLCFSSGDGPLIGAACFIGTTAILCAALHALAFAGIPHLVAILRVVGGTLGAFGLATALEFAPRTFAAARDLLSALRSRSLAARLTFALIAVTLLAYLAAAVAPATDVDSLQYHLGVPLDWLVHGGAYRRSDWPYVPLIGLGEMVNMLGLACGTDCLGAVFQFAGLVCVMVAIASVAADTSGRDFALLAIVGCPVMLFLIPAQKPELLPAAATTIALLLLIRREDALDRSTIVLAFGCATFAIGCKYSFILTGGVVLAIGFVAAWRASRTTFAIAAALGGLVLMPEPVWARNLLLYHDPIAPFLERLKAAPDPLMLYLASFISSGVKPRTFKNWIMLPWSLIGATGRSSFRLTLGLGTLAFAGALGYRGARMMLAAALAAFFLIAAFSQLTPRFFLEPYLWCVAAAAASPPSSARCTLTVALGAQTALVAAMALVLAQTVFPGALTPSTRNRVMTTVAYGYSEGRFLDAHLPRNAVVLAALFQRSQLRAPFVVFDWDDFDAMPAATRTARLTQLLRETQPAFAFFPEGPTRRDFPELAQCLDDPVGAPYQDPYPDMRPFFQNPPTVSWRVYRLSADCAARLRPAQH